MGFTLSEEDSRKALERITELEKMVGEYMDTVADLYLKLEIAKGALAKYGDYFPQLGEIAREALERIGESGKAGC